jgi:CTP:molybdopterin cytidylyltransferase MocA
MVDELDMPVVQGETAEEIAGLARAMLEVAVSVPTDSEGEEASPLRFRSSHPLGTLASAQSLCI